jgi:hypothetical protein
MRDYGLPECVRPCLDIKHFVDCIYLGPLTDANFDDAADTYLTEIGATHPTETLLNKLAGITGL